MARMGEIARVKVVDKKLASRIRAAKQNAKASVAHEAKIAEVRRFVEQCAEAAAPPDAREAWIVEAIRDLVGEGRTYSAEVYEIMVRGLRAVRREIAAHAVR